MAKERLVVVGGDAGGMAAASQARRRRGADELEIVAFERGAYTSYSACGIPYWIGDQVAGGPDSLIAREPAVFRERYAVDVRLGHEVTGIDLAAGKAYAIDRASGAEVVEGFDQLVIGTGAEPVLPAWAAVGETGPAGGPGGRPAGVFFAHTLPDGAAIRAALGPDVRHAVVCGGGYIGVEMAEALLRRGLAVTVVHRGPEPMSSLDPELGARLGAEMERAGVEIRRGAEAVGLRHGDGRVTGVELAGGGVLQADLVVLGLGVRPRVALAREAGLAIGVSGGIAVDDRQRTKRPGGAVIDHVYAAGDCTEVVHRVYNWPMVVPLGTHANKQGRVAGITIGGGSARFAGVVGTAITGFWADPPAGPVAVEVGRTGLSSREMDRAGVAYVSATITSTGISGYLPDAPTLTCRLLAEADTGRVVGGQLVGGPGTAKRIDVVATAVWHGLTAEDLIDLDLGYCPPLSPTWDPVQVAARKLLS